MIDEIIDRAFFEMTVQLSEQINGHQFGNGQSWLTILASCHLPDDKTLFIPTVWFSVLCCRTRNKYATSEEFQDDLLRLKGVTKSCRRRVPQACLALVLSTRFRERETFDIHLPSHSHQPR